MSDHDAELVALIDNELDEGRRTALLARLAADDGLRQRYEELRQTSVPLAASFGALLKQAPLARLRAVLPAGEPIRRPLRRFAGIAFRELAAGLVIGALAAGSPYGPHRPLGCLTGGKIGARRLPNTHTFTRMRPSVR
jgi:anti-sigma factor RsiW